MIIFDTLDRITGQQIGRRLSEEALGACCIETKKGKRLTAEEIMHIRENLSEFPMSKIVSFTLYRGFLFLRYVMFAPKL